MTSQPAAARSKFTNLHTGQPFKALYSGVKTDATATQKIKANGSYFAVPWGGTAGSIGVFPIQKSVAETVKVETGPPVLLAHGKQIADFCFSPSNERILTSCTKGDAIVRLWKMPSTLDAWQPAGKDASSSSGDAPAPPMEMDVPDLFLAGHEKRIEIVRFHPTVANIMASGSADSTVRLWDIEAIQDKLSLTVPNDSTPQCMSFDYAGDAIAAASLDAFLYLYDPRAQITPTQSVATGHNPSKGIKTLWIAPDPMILTSGFTKQGLRELCLYDSRMLADPTTRIQEQGTGVGILLPIYDQALPLIYFGSRGEGIRVYEVASGTMKLVATLKMDKQATQIDMLPKTVCNTTKCEISRFIRLGADNTIELSSVHVPRVNGDSVFQEDLYPPLTSVNLTATPSQWFAAAKASIEPLMVDVIPTNAAGDDKADFPVLPALPQKDAFFAITPTPPSNVKRSKTLRRMSTSKINNPTVNTARHSTVAGPASAPPTLTTSDAPASGNGHSALHRQSTSASISSTSSVTTPLPKIPMETPALLEKRNWFTITWEPNHLRLRKATLFIYADSKAEHPLKCVQLTQMTRIAALTFPGNAAGFTFDGLGVTHRYKVPDVAIRDRWVDVMRGCEQRVSECEAGRRADA
ncbi:Coronin-like protein crn1, partial [Irineochytrium annulatum]